jgi:hypothetical protein
MTNRDLLKEAIADAKAVKETAIANAKLALEETFNPFMKERLSAVLAEMDGEDEKEELEEKKDSFTDDEKAPTGYGKIDPTVGTYGDDEAKKMGAKELEEDEDMNLEELLRELGEMESESVNEAEDLLNDPKKGHGNIEEEEDAEGIDDDADGVPDAMDSDINFSDMSKEEQESFLTDMVTDVIKDMVDSGELEAGHEGEEGEEEEEGNEGEGEEGEEDEDEIDIEKMVAEIKKSKEAKAKKEDEDEEKKKLKEELEEAYNALKHVKSELNEVNLFNAKLLYTNKIFRNKNLSESQKVKVLAAFDKAVSVKEAKLVYETLSEGLKTTKAPVNESLLRGAASKVSGIAPKKPILEVNDQFDRWKVLAGIKKQL